MTIQETTPRPEALDRGAGPGSGRPALDLVVTVDTEADDQWRRGAPLETRNVAFWRPFQDLCERYGVPVTYLVASEITADEAARRLLAGWLSAGTCEVGAHLHPWTTPPFADRPTLRYNDPAHAFPCDLPTGLLGEKLATLTDEIEQALGVRPISFRAGRFGVDGRCAKYLDGLGYLVDSSVTPLTDWLAHQDVPGAATGPDFRSHEARPFAVQGTALLEIPIAIVTTYALLRRFPLLYRAYRAFPLRPLRHRLLKAWLRPQPIWMSPLPDFSASDLVAAFRECARMEAGAAVMMLHSSELMPGGSPYWPTPEAVRGLLGTIEVLLRAALEAGARPTTLSGSAARLRSEGSLPRRPL